MAGKRLTFTQLLLLEIRAHFELKATDPRIPAYQRDVFYAVAREIGRNTPRFVQNANKAKEWQDAVNAHEEAANAR